MWLKATLHRLKLWEIKAHLLIWNMNECPVSDLIRHVFLKKYKFEMQLIKQLEAMDYCF